MVAAEIRRGQEINVTSLMKYPGVIRGIIGRIGRIGFASLLTPHSSLLTPHSSLPHA